MGRCAEVSKDEIKNRGKEGELIEIELRTLDNLQCRKIDVFENKTSEKGLTGEASTKKRVTLH